MYSVIFQFKLSHTMYVCHMLQWIEIRIWYSRTQR